VRLGHPPVRWVVDVLVNTGVAAAAVAVAVWQL